MFSGAYYGAALFASRYFSRGRSLTAAVGRRSRHVDFQVGSWGEFGVGPFDLTSGSTETGATLSQAGEAAHPDRPVVGGQGMKLSLTSGGVGGMYLEVDLGAVRDVVHVRLAIKHGSVTGGVIELLRALDDAGDETFRIEYDVDAREMTVRLVTGETLTAALSAELSWHCVEFGLDASSGESELWLNGLSVDAQIGTFTMLATRRVWLGCVSKDATVDGELYLDELCLDEQYIGPVTREVVSDYADDPARWVVVYNANDGESISWAQSYREARGVPYANLIGLDLSSSETIDEAAFASLSAGITDYLFRNGLTGQVMGVLLGYRVPGKADFSGFIEPIAALLHTDQLHNSPLYNPAAAMDGQPLRPTTQTLGGIRLTARIDGATLADAQALVDRAAVIELNGLGDGLSSGIWLEPFKNTVVDQVEQLLPWALSIERMRTRLPIELPAEDAEGEFQPFAGIQSDGFYWGVQLGEMPSGFFATAGGTRVFCVQLQASIDTGGTMRAASPTQWLGAALAAGYAAGAGATRAFSPSALPYAMPLFSALGQGWTLAEAWLVSSPVLREGLFLAGDPLMTVALPRRGWDVFGPMVNLDALDPDSPVLMLREDEGSVTLPESLRLTDGQEGLYVIRHVDELGRSEAGVNHVRLVNVDGQVVSGLAAPLWPDAPGWRARIENSAVLLNAIWDRPLRATNVSVAEVERLAVATGSVSTAATVKVNGLDRSLSVTLELPMQVSRYRWRVTSTKGVSHVTSWSAQVFPTAEASLKLQLVGGV